MLEEPFGDLSLPLEPGLWGVGTASAALTSLDAGEELKELLPADPAVSIPVQSTHQLGRFLLRQQASHGEEIRGRIAVFPGLARQGEVESPHELPSAQAPVAVDVEVLESGRSAVDAEGNVLVRLDGGDNGLPTACRWRADGYDGGGKLAQSCE